jgi:spore coat protein SA
MAFDVIHFQESAGFLYLLLNAFGSQNKNTVEQFHHSHVAEFMIHLKFFSKAPKESLPYLSMPLKIFQEYISLKLAKRVITVSNHSRSTLFSWNINPEKVTVIANALNESYFEEGGQKQKQNNLLTFLYVGRLVPRKGIDILIQAITILNKDGIDNFRVDIVGEGPLLNYCQDTVKRNHIQNCIVWGLVPQEKLDSLYRQADCLICPSRLEGFGIVLLEAGANDLAIIANDIPVFREIYSDAEVLYFKQNDPVDLARRVSDLINEPNLVPILRERARIKVENYKWQNVVKDYMSIYLNMTARNKG